MITRQEALKKLTSDSAHERVKAARFLGQNSDPSDLPVLRKALQIETVSYVRTALELALRRAANAPSQSETAPVEELEIPYDVRVQIKRRAIEEVTGQLLHEISSPVGLIASSAAREIQNFESSKTKQHVENLQRVFEAIELLKGASSNPRPEEFDLSQLLAEIVLSAVKNQPLDISLHGTKPFLITSDPALVSLAVSNGIRNAVEAVVDCLQNEPHPIIVTWGMTDVDYWVAVLDKGPGVIGPVESTFDTGKTTKRGHSGFGLAIARQAIESLGGSCTLQPAAEGGAHFEVRWGL